jgi:hypothetical protein
MFAGRRCRMVAAIPWAVQTRCHVEGKGTQQMKWGMLRSAQEVRRSSSTVRQRVDGVFVASHNIMDGLFLYQGLLEHYERLPSLAKGAPIVVCLQENNRLSNITNKPAQRAGGESTLFFDTADEIAHVLSQAGSNDTSRYEVVRSSYPRLAIIFDTSQLVCLDTRTAALPKMDKLPLWNRLVGLRLEQKNYFYCRFQTHKKQTFDVVNFHLDAAGTNAHRIAQFHHMVEQEGTDNSGRNIKHFQLFCGDTNLFGASLNSQVENFRALLQPGSPGANMDLIGDVSVPTHYFSRANEPKFGHQIVYNAGKLGLDFPGCYDVFVARNMGLLSSVGGIDQVTVEDHGVIDTPMSDHNLVHGRFSFAAS